MTETPNVDPTNGVPPVPPPPAVPQYGAGPQYGAAAPQYVAGPAAPMSDSDQRLWATLAHIGPIVIGFVAPLVIWLIYRERGHYVADQSKEALNFQITLAIAYIVSLFLMIIVIGFVTFAIAWIGSLVLMIMAAIAANKGEAYRYPLNIRLIK